MAGAQDFFNRTDSTDLGANWTTPTTASAQSLEISSGIIEVAVLSSSTGGNLEIYNVTSFGRNQTSELSVVAHTGSTSRNLFLLLRTDTTTSALNRYLLGFNAAGSLLAKVVAGAVTTIATNGTAWSTGDVLRANVVGTQLAVFRNGALDLSAADTALTSGAFIGIRMRSSSAKADLQADNWAAADLPISKPLLARFP